MAFYTKGIAYLKVRMQKSTVNLGSFKITDKIEIGVKGGSGNRKG